MQSLVRNTCLRLVFSSSGSLYKPGADFTVDESSPLDPQSPYAATKMMVERVLEDAASAQLIRVLSLRYFNPVGADPKYRTGLQDPVPSRTLGKIIEAADRKSPFTITGVDWPTRDGSGIRDFVHVWDLARAHVRGLQRFDDVTSADQPHQVINLGTGLGTTVRELVAAFQEVTGEPLDVQESGPRPGDVVGCYTRSDRASTLLGWSAEKSIKDGIADSLAWSAIRPSKLT